MEILSCIQNYPVKIQTYFHTPSVFNHKIDNIYVIHLRENVSKKKCILSLMQKSSISFHLVTVDRLSSTAFNALHKLNPYLTPAEWGCCMSHLWCLTHILTSHCKNAIVFEDDVLFHKEFIPRFLHILETRPALDFVLLGAHDLQFTKHHQSLVTDGLYRPTHVKHLYGAHANYYSHVGAKRMFYIRTTNPSFFDNEYGLMFNTLPTSSFICSPQLVITNMGESSLNHARPLCSLEETDYYRQCMGANFCFQQYHYICPHVLDKTLYSPGDTFAVFLHKCLVQYFYGDRKKANQVMERIDTEFYADTDIYEQVMVPNNLSKK